MDAIVGKVPGQAVGLSVIIPHLNQPDALRRCLTSLHEQRNVDIDYEIIVVDNGSRELPEEICRMWPGVRLYLQETPGPGPARNTGISHAQGEILAFIDADCRAHPDWLAAILRAFDDPEVQVIGGDVRVPFEDRNNPTALEAYERIYAYRNRQYVASGYSGTGNLSMRRGAFDAVGEFGGIDVAEDRDWGLRARDQGYVTTYREDMIVYHPARTNFAEMQAKWDRHIAHDFAKVSGVKAKLRWFLRACALLVSPVAEIPRILRSPRLQTFKERWLAFTCLSRIRAYRFLRMTGLLFRDNHGALSGAWNRD